jgi:hypothetical protein
MRIVKRFLQSTAGVLRMLVLVALGGAGLAGTAAPALAQTPGTRTPIWLYWNSARAENVTTRSTLVGFERIRVEGYLFANPHPGTVPVKTFYHDTRDDYALVATAKGESDLLAAGYRFIRIEGYGFAQPFPTTVPLKLYWNPSRTDHATVAEARSEQDQKNSGYTYQRIEAYVFPANDPDFGARLFSVPVKTGDATTVYLATRTAFVMHEDIAGNGCRYTWIGTTGGHPHDAVLTICDSGVVGTILKDGRVMEVNPFRTDPEELFDYRVPPNHVTPTGTIIDVGIGYSPGVQQEFGVMAAAYGLRTLPRVYIAAYQQLAIDHANAVLGASGAKTTLRLARTKMLDIFEDAFSSTSDALNQIAEVGISTPCSTGPDRYRAKAFRDFTGADLVSVWLGNRPQGFNHGEAWIAPSTIFCDDKLAFSVVWGADTVLRRYTFVHEIGHNLGVIHANGEATGNVDWDVFQEYGHGHVDAVNGFRDVMAYGKICKPTEAACPHLPYFSTPHVRIEPSNKARVVAGGAAMGSSASANAASRIAQRSAAVAGYRTLKCPATMLHCGGGTGDETGGGTSPNPDPELPPVQVK